MLLHEEALFPFGVLPNVLTTVLIPDEELVDIKNGRDLVKTYLGGATDTIAKMKKALAISKCRS